MIRLLFVWVSFFHNATFLYQGMLIFESRGKVKQGNAFQALLVKNKKYYSSYMEKATNLEKG